MNNTSVLNASDDNDIDEVFYSFSDAFKFPVLACYLIIVAVAMVGNFVVCCTIMVDRNLRNNPTTIFLFSLACSDLVTVTVVAPLDLEMFFSTSLDAWRNHVRNLEHSFCHNCTHLDFDPFSCQCRSLQEPQ